MITHKQGDEYGLTVALIGIFLADGMRAGALWEKWITGGTLEVWLMIVAIALKVLCTVCAIRVLAPEKLYNRRAGVVLAFALAFAWLTA